MERREVRWMCLVSLPLLLTIFSVLLGCSGWEPMRRLIEMMLWHVRVRIGPWTLNFGLRHWSNVFLSPRVRICCEVFPGFISEIWDFVSVAKAVCICKASVFENELDLKLVQESDCGVMMYEWSDCCGEFCAVDCDKFAIAMNMSNVSFSYSNYNRTAQQFVQIWQTSKNRQEFGAPGWNV